MALRYISALCVVLVAVPARSGILKAKQISLPAGSIVMDVAIRQNINGTDKTIATVKLDLNGDDRKVTIFDAAAEMPPDKVAEIEKEVVPSIEDRNIFPRGHCPQGYVRRGTVCFPDDDQ